MNRYKASSTFTEDGRHYLTVFVAEGTVPEEVERITKALSTEASNVLVQVVEADNE